MDVASNGFVMNMGIRSCLHGYFFREDLNLSHHFVT